MRSNDSSIQRLILHNSVILFAGDAGNRNRCSHIHIREVLRRPGGKAGCSALIAYQILLQIGNRSVAALDFPYRGDMENRYHKRICQHLGCRRLLGFHNLHRTFPKRNKRDLLFAEPGLGNNLHHRIDRKLRDRGRLFIPERGLRGSGRVS